MGELADVADEAGVVVALEIHGDIMASSDVDDPARQKIGRDSIRVNYDTANVEYYSGDRAEDDLAKITGYLAHVHLKDTTGGKGNWNFPAIGDGHVDFGRVREILDGAGYAGRVLGRARVRGRAVALARGRRRGDAPLVPAPDRARRRRARSTCRR